MANVNREGKIGIGLSIEPELSQNKSAKVIRDILNLQKKLGPLKLDWAEIAKRSQANVSQLREMSAAAKLFSKTLSSATQSSFKELGKLGDQLDEANQAAASLTEQYANAKGSAKKSAINKQLGEVVGIIKDLNKQVEDHQKKNHKAGMELKQLTKTQRDYQKRLDSAADYTPKNAFKDMISSLAKNAGGGISGVKGAISDVGGAAAKGVGGGVARQGLAAEAAGMEGIVGTLGKAAGILGGVALALGAVWKFISAASDHQTKLNKALLDGAGFVNDFTSNTKEYRATIDDLRGASQDAAYSLLKFGGNSETAAKAINAFAKESTGSLIQTRGALISLGKGDIKAGVEEFSRNAMVYGKALGMETEEVAGMMGKFISETGYGADQVQGLMGNIVKAAATSNMPMTKFMSIFRQVLPDVELYQNRLEELTGTIKLLSKTMSAKDVKNFMEAFAKGFQGMDFKQRLKTVLIAGTGFVSKTLGKDFEMKAKAMAQNFDKYASPDMGSFEDAMKGGEATMAKYIAKSEANAAKKGAVISGAQIGDAMKLASYEAARKKGGPLNMATAMRGGGVYSTYKILNKMGQTLTTGFDGLSEHVMKQLGISEQQYDALRTTAQSLNKQRTQLQMYGKTTSKSMNKGLREAIATRKGIKASEVLQEDMQKATDEDMFQAAEMSNQMKEGQQTAEELATQQVSATLSISEKIDNVIGFLLEKLYRVMQPILDLLDEIWGWITGSKAEQEQLKAIKSLQESFEGGSISKESFDVIAESLKKQVSAGADNKDIAANFMKMINPGSLTGITVDALKGAGLEKTGIFSHFEPGDLANMLADPKSTDRAMQLIAKEMGTDFPKFLAKLSTVNGLVASKETSDKGLQKAEDRSTSRRAGTSAVVYKTPAERQAAKDAGDLENDMQEIGKAAAGVKTPGPVAPSGGPATTKSPTDDAIKQTADTVADTHDASEQHSAEVEKQNDQIYDGISDVAGILKKGIKFEQSWFNTKWMKNMKEATLDSFQKALLEFLILQTMAEDSDNLKKELKSQGANLVKSGKSAADIIPGYTGSKEWSEYISQDVLGSKQTGGPIPDTGMYKLHRGEYVVPAMPAPAGGGGGSVHANVVINGTSLSAQQLEGAVYGAMDKLSRRA